MGAALTAAIAIDASGVDNGTLEVIPGSHAGGILEHMVIDSGWTDMTPALRN